MSLPLDLNEAFPLERFQQSVNRGAVIIFSEHNPYTHCNTAIYAKTRRFCCRRRWREQCRPQMQTCQSCGRARGIGCMSGVPSVQCLRDGRANRARSFSQRIVCQVRITGCRLRLSVAEQFTDDRKAQGRRLPLCSHRLCRRSWSSTSRRPAAFRTSSHTAFRL
jgi:hypothetical protein